MANKLSDNFGNPHPVYPDDEVAQANIAAKNVNAAATNTNESVENLNVEVSRLSRVINGFSQTIGSIPMKVAEATKNVAVDSYNNIHEQINIKHSSNAARVAALAGGQVAATVTENVLKSQAIQNIKNAAKNKVRAGVSSVYYGVKNKISKPEKARLPSSDVNYESEEFSEDAATAEPIKKTNRKPPKAKNGAYIKQDGKVHAHKGELIVPADAIANQYQMLTNVYSAIKEQNALLSEKKGAVRNSNIRKVDPAKQQFDMLTSINSNITNMGGVLNEFTTNFSDNTKAQGLLTSSLELLFPLFSGGMYKNDIARSKNPLITITSGILEMYRWQRLYGELTKRQLNQLILLGGGTQQEVVGKRNLMFEQVAKWRLKLHLKLKKKIDEDNEKKKRGEKVSGAKTRKFASMFTGGLLGDILFQDNETMMISMKEQAAASVDALMKRVMEEQALPSMTEVLKSQTIFSQYKAMPEELRLAGRYGPGGPKIGRYDDDDKEGLIDWKGRREYSEKSFNEQMDAAIAKEQQAKRKIDDAFFAPGSVKSITTKDGQSIVPSKQDQIKVLKKDVEDSKSKSKNKVVSLLEDISEGIKDTISVQTESKNIQGNTQKHISDQTKIEQDRAKQEKKKRRAEMFESIKNAGKKTEGFAVKAFDFGVGALKAFSTLGITGMITLTGILAALIANPKGTIDFIKWVFASKEQFTKTVASFLKLNKLVGTGISKLVTKTGQHLGLIEKTIKKTSALKIIGQAGMGAFKKKGAVSAMKTVGEVATKQLGKSLGLKVAGKAGTKAAGKLGAKLTLGKIPVLGALVGIWMAISRFKKGDVVGGLGEIASGVAALLPGPGTAISLLIDGLLIARDLGSKKASASMNTGIKVGAKLGLRAGGKMGSKLLIKKIPVVGAILGVMFGISRFKKKDIVGGLGEIASGIASIFPGPGTAISVLIDGLLMARDFHKAGSDKPKRTTVSTSKMRGFLKTLPGLGLILGIPDAMASFRAGNTKQGIIELVSAISSTVPVVGGMISGLLQSLLWLQRTKKIKPKVKTGNAISDFIVGMLGFVKDILVKTMKGVGKALWWVVKQAGKSLKMLYWTFPKAVIKGVFSLLKGLGKFIMWEIKVIFKAFKGILFDVPKMLVKALASGAYSAVSAIGNGVSAIGNGIVGGVVGGAKAIGRGVKGGVSKVWSGTKSVARFMNPFSGKSNTSTSKVLSEGQDTTSGKRSNSGLLTSLIKQYGRNQVIGLYNQTGDLREVQKILSHGADAKNEKGLEISRLINAYPDGADEIITLVKKDVPIDEIRKIMAKKYGETKKVITNKEASDADGKRDKLKKDMDANQRMLDTLQSSELTPQQQQNKKEIEEQLARQKKEYDSMEESRNDVDVSSHNTPSKSEPVKAKSSDLEKKPAQSSPQNISKSADPKFFYFSSDKSPTKEFFERANYDAQQKIKEIIKSNIPNHQKRAEIQKIRSDLKESFKKKAEQERNEKQPRKVNDWIGKAKGILTHSGEMLQPSRNDVTYALSSPASRLGDKAMKLPGEIIDQAKNKVGSTIDRATKLPGDIIESGKRQTTGRINQTIESVKRTPDRLMSGLSSAANASTIGDIVSGRRTIGDVAANIGHRTIDPITQSATRVVNLPSDIYKSGKQKVDSTINQASRLPGDIKSGAMGKVNSTIGQAKRLPQDTMSQIPHASSSILSMRHNNSGIKESGGRSIDHSKIYDTSLQEQINDSTATLKTSKKLNETIKDSGNDTAKGVAAIVNNSTSVVNNSSSSSNVSNSGGQQTNSPFWKPMDSILAGINI